MSSPFRPDSESREAYAFDSSCLSVTPGTETAQSRFTSRFDRVVVTIHCSQRIIFVIRGSGSRNGQALFWQIDRNVVISVVSVHLTSVGSTTSEAGLDSDFSTVLNPDRDSATRDSTLSGADPVVP